MHSSRILSAMFIKCLHHVTQLCRNDLRANADKAVNANRHRRNEEVVVAGINMELFRHGARKLRQIIHVSRSVFHTDDVGHLSKTGNGSRLDGYACPARHIMITLRYLPNSFIPIFDLLSVTCQNKYKRIPAENHTDARL